MPVSASIDASRDEIACCVSPNSLPAAARLPVRAIAVKISNADRSVLWDLCVSQVKLVTLQIHPPVRGRSTREQFAL